MQAEKRVVQYYCLIVSYCYVAIITMTLKHLVLLYKAQFAACPHPLQKERIKAYRSMLTVCIVHVFLKCELYSLGLLSLYEYTVYVGREVITIKLRLYTFGLFSSFKFTVSVFSSFKFVLGGRGEGGGQ